MNKPDYDTIRGLEKKGHGVFKVAGALGVVGVVLLVVAAPVGIAVLLAAAGIFFYGMVWMMKLQREPVRHLYCPYCASKNDVFVSRKEFSCDICKRRVGVAADGQPIPLEPIEEDDD